MLTVVIDNPYIRNGCRQGYALWMVGKALDDPLGVSVVLPDWAPNARGETDTYANEQAQLIVQAAVQVVHGHEVGVFMSPTYRAKHKIQWWGLTPGCIAAILTECNKRCEGDYPQPDATAELPDTADVIAEHKPTDANWGLTPLS